jgi:hypothetical protein
LFEKVMEDTATMDCAMTMDGKCIYFEKDKPDIILHTLHRSATVCSCELWTAYHLQRPHLFLMHGEFSRKLWASRWRQLPGLESSVGNESKELENSVVVDDSLNLRGDGGDVGTSIGHPAHSSCRSASLTPASDTDVGYHEILNVAVQLANSIENVSNNLRKKEFFGQLITLNETVKGNYNTLQGKSMEEILESHKSLYKYSSTGKQELPIESQTDGRTCVGLGKDEGQMKRGQPPLPRNHSKKRKKSVSEISNDNHRQMINASRRPPRCSLCWENGHRSDGMRCGILRKYRAVTIGWKDIQELSVQLGNPTYYGVEQADEDTTNVIGHWLSNCGSNTIPFKACYLVLLHTYYSDIANQHYRNNLIEVAILEEGGKIMQGWERAYYRAHQISEWLQKYCFGNHRTKHCLSALRKVETNQDQQLSREYIA